MTFAAGDVVFLKSGGEAMTVVAIEHDEAMCLWTGDDGDLFREMIPTVALQTAQSAEEEDEEEGEDSEDNESDDDTDEDEENEKTQSKKTKEVA